MAKLRYTAITSLDGYVADTAGNFDWAAPDEEVHAAVNELERPVGTYLYGRRMYEVMAFWETAHKLPDQSAPVREYAEIWQAADKVVYSSTLDAVSTARTTLEASFVPADVQRMKEGAASDISIAGPTLAGHALRAGLVDECHFFLNPVVVGGGTPSLPDNVFLRLELRDDQRFTNGVVYVHYSVRN
jgi:dihydrofolate reductase